MRTQRLWVSVTLLLGLAGTGVSQATVLQWEHEGAHTAITWRAFYTRMAPDNTVTQGEAAVREIDAAQCQTLSRTPSCAYESNESRPYRPGTTRCGTMTCPGPGAYTFGLRANDSEMSTDPADLAAIGFNEQCQCIAFRDAILGTVSQPPPAHAEPPLPPPLQEPPPAVPPTRQPPPAVAEKPPQTPTPETPPPATPPENPTPEKPTPPPTAPGANLVTAPTTQRPWRSGSFAGTQTQTGMDSAVQRNGHPVQKLTGAGRYYATTTSRAFAVEAGQTYEMSALVKLENITDFVEIDVFYWSTEGQQLTPWGEAVGGRLKGTHDWTPIAGQVTVPPGANRAVIQVRARSQGGAAWVDDVQMQAREKSGDQAAPPQAPAPPSARPMVPTTPETPTPLSHPTPAPTRQGLLKQFAVLEAEYQAAQQAIRATYETTLQRLATDHTAAAQHQRAQAHAAGTKALEALYQTLVQRWQALVSQWEEAA